MKEIVFFGNSGGGYCLHEDHVRDAAVALATYACTDADLQHMHRALGDPVFEEVTEGRAKWPKYSACGDLAHWLLYKLGIRDEHIVNRTNDGGSIPWKVGANLSRLVYKTGTAFRYSRALMQGAILPKRGDILYVRYPEHVCVLLDDIPTSVLSKTPVSIHTADYGQVYQSKPAGLVRPGILQIKTDRVMLGARELVGWVNVVSLPFDAPAVVPDTFVGGFPVETEHDNDQPEDGT